MSDDAPGSAPGEPAAAPATAGLEPWLRDILRCPRCRSQLRDGVGPTGGAELQCTSPECGLAYRVDDGIPVLLIDEARPAHQTPQA